VRLPLFPLNTVLFPGGILPLRVFEARYMDMVRDCMRDDTTFGVCLIAGGREAGNSARPEAVGCEARIVAWDMPQLGVLHIRAVGLNRFRVGSSRPEPNGLVIGEVESLDPDADSALAPEHAPCAELLTRIIDDLGAQAAERRRTGQAGDHASNEPPFQKPYRLESTVWVGNRLCEVLPVPLKAKQKLMELDDARTRLDIVTQYLKQHAILK
jgi:Lon protease-like protein